MPQAAEATLKPATPGRDARAPLAGGEGVETACATELLSTDDLRLIGQTIGGAAHWQADCAREIGYSKSNMTRYLNASRPTNPLLAKLMRRLILGKIDKLTKLLSIVGLPAAGDVRTAEVQKTILAATAKAREISPTT